MFPVLPSKTTPALEQMALDVAASAAALGRGLHPLIHDGIERFMEKINSYYTNAMEGNPSKLKDIEAALNKKLSKDPSARNYQFEHLAHIQVQEAMFERLRLEPGLGVCSAPFLRWLHEQRLSRMPPVIALAGDVRAGVMACLCGAAAWVPSEADEGYLLDTIDGVLHLPEHARHVRPAAAIPTT